MNKNINNIVVIIKQKLDGLLIHKPENRRYVSDLQEVPDMS